MSWQNYAGFSLVVEKNGVEIERGNYSGFILDNSKLARVQTYYDGTSDLGVIGGLYYGAADWALFEGAAANTSSLLKSEGLLELLTNNGDTIKIYNPNVGPRYCLCFTRSDSGSYKRIKRWYIGAGTTYDYSEYSVYDGGNYALCIGVLVDGYRALPFCLVSYQSSYGVRYNTADFYCWQAFSKSGFESTHSYNYFFVFSDAWQPPTPPGPGYNPYADGGTSEPSGDPTGDYDDTSDVISVPSAPSFNLGITSLINVWVPSTTDINKLAAYLWSNFDLTDPSKTLSKMFTDPLSYILSLHMLPFTVSSSTAITVTLAGLATTVSMPPATEQFHDIDCGSVTISEYWGNYLDYTYTKIVLCLPFCGQVDLDPDEVMGKTIKVKYRVDIITGAFVCFVYIDGDKVLGQYAGNCAAQIPISAADFSRLNAAVLGVAGAAASAFGSAALGGHGGMLNGASGGLISSIAANAQNAKIRAQHSGGLTGAPGFMGIQKPYLIIHRPRQSVPEDYEQFKGYPSNVTMQLSSCTGFTSVREITLNGLPFTDGELSELKSILEGGVIL